MKTIKQLLLMKHNGICDQLVASHLKIGKGTVNTFYNRFLKSGVKWPLPNDMSDKQLSEIIYPSKLEVQEEDPSINWGEIERELSRPGVTLQLLWEEYRAGNPEGYGRSAFYQKFKVYRKGNKCSLPVIHKGGDKLFIDYSGDSLSYVDRSSGEIISVETFVSTWGASGYAYVDITHSQKKEDWVLSHVRCFEFFKYLPKALVPDNLKSGVLKADLFDPLINPLYEKFAEHYSVAVLPARVRKPKDKAIVENCVLQVQRRVLAPLRDKTFFSLEQIREAVADLLLDFNQRPMKDYGGMSRKERFDLLDKPYAIELTKDRFEFTDIKNNVRVKENYHVRYDDHFYSVPYTFINKMVDIYLTGNTLEIYHESEHLCRHPKKPADFGYETRKEHAPDNHKYIMSINPTSLILKGGEVGPNTSTVIKNILEKKEIHPESRYNMARGILSLSKKYGKERLENASQRAIYYSTLNYKSIQSILNCNLDKEVLDEKQMDPINKGISHENIRGPLYYGQETKGGYHA